MSYWQALVPPDFQVPVRLEADGFHLRMLTVNDLVKDYDAVMSSSARLKGSMRPGSNWPDGLTLEDDLIDLGWHQREFISRRSFSYTVMSPDEAICLAVATSIQAKGAATTPWRSGGCAQAHWLRVSMKNSEQRSGAGSRARGPSSASRSLCAISRGTSRVPRNNNFVKEVQMYIPEHFAETRIEVLHDLIEKESTRNSAHTRQGRLRCQSHPLSFG